ncbi:MAG: alpha-amylase, partial [Vallitaleaceae bacterium]|nr:alpha-amylase [Vallitaleaceae bacterium]
MKRYSGLSVKLLALVGLVLVFSAACQKEAKPTGNEGGYEKNGVWYEIFVRAFADSDGDGIGDFRGMIDKLDYLKDMDENTDHDLGIDGIWLMPIHPSPSYHGYDVTDYYSVNPEYGSMEDFEEFIEKAHERNIDVIIDLVLNHSSAQHPWFQEAISNPDSPYRDYYRIIGQEAEGYDFKKQVWGHKVWNPIGQDVYYAIFWDQMPDLNYDSEVLRTEMIKVA